MYYLGIDLGGSNIAVGLFDDAGKKVLSKSTKTLHDRTFEEIVSDMAQLCQKIIVETKISIDEIKSIGIGTPGACDCEKGILLYACTFSFTNVNFREELQKYIDLPVYIENDANCAVLAEYFVGAAKGISDAVMITIGTGIGGGVIVDGKIMTGFNGIAAELGHFVIVKGGIKCGCGRAGCFESYASATAIIRMTKEFIESNPATGLLTYCDGDINNVSGKTIFDAAKLGDKDGEKLVEIYEDYLAEGIASLINIFQPEVFLVGGGVSKEGEYLLVPVRKIVSERTYMAKSDLIAQTRLVKAEMGNDAGMLGAAMLGKEFSRDA